MDEDIVITGISGRYPDCDSFEQLKTCLLEGVDLITTDDRRFPPGTSNTPFRSGKINDVESFDAAYFGVSPKQADIMDPRHRVLLETAFESIVDAGYNPEEIKGSNTGVYVAIGMMDNSQAYKELENTNGYSIIGMTLSQAANRISYVFDLKGPSFALDTACSSAMYAMVNAVKAMEQGEIDAAIVGATHLVFHPHETSEFNKLNMLSESGRCRVFNKVRDGYVRSECVASMFLQRRKNSRRIYATVLGAKMNSDGFKKEGITYPNSEMQALLMKSLYTEKKFDPQRVNYVEMHGTGTPAGDTEECQSICDIFCSTPRREPLPVGAVKSNIGHSETSAAMGSISKALTIFETGIIPANLHCDDLDNTLPGIKEGNLVVATKNLPFRGGAIALNSFGFGGSNAHAILDFNPKTKPKFPKRINHRLMHVSGRTEEAVKFYFDEIEKRAHDDEMLALVDSVHRIDIKGHTFRGYKILGENPSQEIARVHTEKRPIWFVYSGMGSQWNTMGKDLMKIEVFRNTFMRCAEALKPYGIDLERNVTSEDPSIFEDITNCFSSIAAIEIALTDVLRSFGIEPDGICGHSLGEVGCAYADGYLTPEQAVLVGYARGYATVRSKCAPGQMAAIGLGAEECQKYLPEDVVVACRNSASSVTISGVKDSVVKVVEEFTARGVFARLVNTAGYAFHSKFLHDAGPHLYEFVKKVITSPKPRSKRWVSSSWAEEEWDNKDSKYNSAAYHHHNYISPVLFDQIYKHIPKNAIVIEVAPQGLLLSILKKELGPNVTCISLANRQSKDNFHFLLSSIGKIYLNGGLPDLRKFYPEISFPVSRGTPSIGSFVKWDHSAKWFTPYIEKSASFGKKITVNISDNNYSYLRGHNIDGRVLMPATGYLELVWRVLAESNCKNVEEFPVVFENVRTIRATVLPLDEDVVFLVNIMKQSGNFEIIESGSIVSTGKIAVPRDINQEYLKIVSQESTENGTAIMTESDIYKLYHLKRYYYEGLFRGIEQVHLGSSTGKLKWKGKFTPFLDTMLQITLLADNSPDLMLPTFIERVVIDPRNHLMHFCENNTAIPVHFNKYLNVIKSGKLEIVGLESTRAPKRRNIHVEPNLETCSLVPYHNDSKSEINMDLTLLAITQIILENNEGNFIIKTTEAVPEKNGQLIKKLSECATREPQACIDVVPVVEAKNVDVIIIQESSIEQIETKKILSKLRKNGFVVFHGKRNLAQKLGLPIVYENVYMDKGLFLLREMKRTNSYAVVQITNQSFDWLEKLKNLIKEGSHETIYLFSQNEAESGIIGLMKCLYLEPYHKINIICVFIQDRIENFSPDSDFYRNQLDKNLTFNVYRKGCWGSYRHVPLNELQNIEAEHATLSIQTLGDLSTLTWIERPSQYFGNCDSSELVHVFYSALNFKDVMTVTGKLPSPINDEDPTFPEVAMGLEFSGVCAKSKKKVMGISNACLSLQTITDPLFTWEVPSFWSLEDAATVPVVYATCYYAMIIRGQMQSKESILIHAGTGGVGLAAINIALSMDCEVYTTCSTQEKRDFLKRTFPKIKDQNIGHSRDGSFEIMIKQNTKGRGVDLVLNSLASDLFQASMRCIATRGRFLEIGKVDLMAGTPINAKLFLKNTSFHGVFLDDLFTAECKTKQDLSKLLHEGITKGVVRPLPREVFSFNEAEDAFRHLSMGKHKGKVLIKLRNEDQTAIKNPLKKILATPKIYFDPEKTYILVGGLGGFGLELSNFLIKRNAKKIILNSRRGITTGYQSYCLKKWASIPGITVKVNTDDTSTKDGARSLIEFAERLGPVGGVFNMALQLSDAILENQTPETFTTVFRPKIVSCLQLDHMTRYKCPRLEHFVVFSSVATGRGNPGQSNYGMANSAMERLCEKRRDDGLPALAIQWGVVGDVGAVAETEKYDRNMSVGGLLPQSISSCLDSLEKFMLQPNPLAATHVLEDRNGKNKGTSGKTPIEAIAHILGIKNIESVDKHQTLSQLGLDSLMVTEIKQTLHRNFSIELETEQIRDLTFTTIAKLIDTNSEDEETVEPKHANNMNGTNGFSLKTVNGMLPKDMVLEIINGKYNRTVFFLPPIEGKVDLMLPLADKLKANVYCLQVTKELDFDNAQSYGSYFSRQIKNIQKSGPYYICGYSYGSLLTFEIAVQLESEGKKVKTFFIDGSPSFIQRILQEAYVRNAKNTEKSKTNILESFNKLFDDIDLNKANSVLDDKLTWEDQLNVLASQIAKETEYNVDDIALSADRFYKRVVAGFFYKPSRTFKGKATLIRSAINYLDFPEDYNLNTLCEEPVEVHKLEGNHQEILLGDNVEKMANIINQRIE